MEDMNLIEKLLLYSSMVFSDPDFEVYNHFFNYWGVAALLAVCGLMYFGFRGMGLWAKNTTFVLGGVLMLTGAIAMHAQLGKPLRASPYWLQRMNEGGGVVLVYPPRKIPDRKIVEFLVDKGSTSQYYWTPLTEELEGSIGKMMQEYTKNKQRGKLMLRWQKSLNPEGEMHFYYLPPEAPMPKDGVPNFPGALPGQGGSVQEQDL